MFCGLVRPTGGRALVLGHDVRHEPLAVKAKIGIMPEEVNTYERLTARELLVFTGRLHGLSRNEAEERTNDRVDPNVRRECPRQPQRSRRVR